MIKRDCLNLVRTRLQHFDAVALIGPRQVGKTTLAREIVAERGEAARYLDLESPRDRRQLDDPDAYFTAFGEQLIVLDEIQRVPEIFQVLRGQIDARRRAAERRGGFLLLGSASMDLLRQASESLAGRISFVELPPLHLLEAGAVDGTATIAQSALDALWLKGGFPESYLRTDERVSLQWRQDFIQTYLERDVPQFGLQIAAERLGLFWRMLANDQGELFNAQRYARSLDVSGHTIARYLQIFEQLLLVRCLQPWARNGGKRLVKAVRPFVRDSGLLHALLNLTSMTDLRSHPVSGKSWEGFVIENVLAAIAGAARPYFYRTGAGAEIDLVLEFAPGRCWAIEIKSSSAPTLDRGFHLAADDLAAERRILVHRGVEAFPMRGGIEAMPLGALMSELRAMSQKESVRN